MKLKQRVKAKCILGNLLPQMVTEGLFLWNENLCVYTGEAVLLKMAELGLPFLLSLSVRTSWSKRTINSCCWPPEPYQARRKWRGLMTDEQEKENQSKENKGRDRNWTRECADTRRQNYTYPSATCCHCGQLASCPVKSASQVGRDGWSGHPGGVCHPTCCQGSPHSDSWANGRWGKSPSRTYWLESWGGRGRVEVIVWASLCGCRAMDQGRALTSYWK